MFVTKPMTIEIVASGVGPAEISLVASGPTTAEYVGDSAFSFKVLQEGEGSENQDAPPAAAAAMTLNNSLNNNVKASNLQDHNKLFSRSNGHLPGGDRLHAETRASRKQLSASNGHLPNNQFVTKNTNNKNLFFSRSNESKLHQPETESQTETSTTGLSMSFLQSLDAKLQRLHDYAGRHRRSRRSTDAANNNNNNTTNNNNNHIVQHKKPFMTVVRQGTFLKPPPELAALLGLADGSSHGSSSQGSESSLNASHSQSQPASLLYSFASRPRVLLQAHRRPTTHAVTHAVTHAATQPATHAAHAGHTIATTPGKVRRRRDVHGQDATEDGPLYTNLMYDRRVIRGNTFAHQPLPSADAQEAAAALRQVEARRRALARRKAQQSRQTRGRPGTPPPVHGRQHLDVQTDRYLEEIFDKPLESEVCVQTDLFAERPPTPPFVPATTCSDAETQVLPGELFNFDEEVVPILEVLVGRTMEQALVEVLEEEETAAAQRQRTRLELVRLEHLAEQARLEEQERRLRLEKERRVAEHFAEKLALEEVEARVSAASISTGYLEQLLPTVLDNLHETGVIKDEDLQDVDEKLMPWLMSEVKEELRRMLMSKDIISEVVREVLATRAELWGTADSAGHSASDSPRAAHGDVRPDDRPEASSGDSRDSRDSDRHSGGTVVGERGDAGGSVARGRGRLVGRVSVGSGSRDRTGVDKEPQ